MGPHESANADVDVRDSETIPAKKIHFLARFICSPFSMTSTGYATSEPLRHGGDDEIKYIDARRHPFTPRIGELKPSDSVEIIELST